MRRRAGERRQPKQTRRNKDRFLMLTEPMLDSPALRVLSLGALRVLFRISLEHLRHNRQNNGNLLVTYEDFVAYGLHRHAVAPAIRELRKLGFIAITRQGGGGNAEHHIPTLYELTFEPTKSEHSGLYVNARNSWLRFAGSSRQTDEQNMREAKEAAIAARTDKRVRVQKRKPIRRRLREPHNAVDLNAQERHPISRRPLQSRPRLALKS